MTPDLEVRRRALLLAAVLGVLSLAAASALAALWINAKRTEPERAAARSARSAPATRAQAPARPPAKPKANPQLFAPTSFWNRRLKASTAIDPGSAALVQGLAAEVTRELQGGIGPWIATGQSSTPLYRVGPSQRRVRVKLDAGAFRGAGALKRAFASVPIPRGAKPAQGPDRHMTVWQPSTDRLWELFKASRQADGWHANWGGAIRSVSKSPGYYTAAAWPGATSNWGATATSLPVIGGTVLIDDLRAGRIDHALAINLPYPRAGTFAWPAQRTDGVGATTALPEGARLRLDPTLNVSDLHLPRLMRIIARAAQRYGFVVRDQTKHAISLFFEDPTPTGRDPYRRFFAGKTPSQLLAKFPWDRLQVVRMRLCTTAPCRPA